MPKRFTDTKLGRDPWFRKLSCTLKCAVRFLFDECDNTGVWVVDMDAMAFYLGEKVDLDELLKKVNGDKIRIEWFGRDKLFVVDFVNFQYGTLSENCKPHKPIISQLKKHGLYERVLKGYQKGIETLEEKDQEIDQEKDCIKGGMGENSGWVTMPSTDQHVLELPDINAGQVEQLWKISKKQDLSRQDCLGLWTVFKVQNFTGKKYYADVGAVYSHFLNWTKTQKIENGNSKTPGKDKHAGANQLLDRLQNTLATSGGAESVGPEVR